MANNYLPTALETPDCPPHHWFIEVNAKHEDGMGWCLKCPATKDFSGNGNGHKLKENQHYLELMHLKSSNGGRKNKGKTRKPRLVFI